jgi:hypothetical protein
MTGDSSSENPSSIGSRSFQSESDVYLGRDWRGLKVPSKTLPLTTSPVSAHGPMFENEVHAPLEERFLGDRPHRTKSDPDRHAADDANLTNNTETVAKNGPRRWLSVSSATKGLNPGAKVFRLPSKPATQSPHTGHSSKLSFDALNPNGLGSSTVTSSSSTSTSLLRAFAPSPAEREVLQRALGGSSNASLDRLPSLPDVRPISVPNSPARSPGQAHAILDSQPREAQRETGKALLPPGWLRNLPQVSIPKFSPWEDEEPSAIKERGSRVER